MADSETPLVTHNPQSARDSNKKALKAAGLTLLACLLLAGQGLTAYLVMGQRGQLQELDMRMHRLKEISSRSAMGPAAPMKMHVPMSSMRLLKLKDESADSKDAAATPPPKDDSSLTQCQKESQGLTDTRLPSFRPQCDRVGGYLPKQCWQEVCWCVDANGKEVPGTVGNTQYCANGRVMAAQAFAAPALLLQPKVEEAKEN